MFAYDEAVAERYPKIRAGVIHATNLANGPTPRELLDEYRTEQRVASERLNATALADLPQVAAWRRAFARFGVKPTRYRSAVEAWLATYQPQGQIKSYVLSPAKPHTGSSESAENESH